MGWFRNAKKAYSDVGTDLLNMAMAIELRNQTAFDNHSVNNLEAVIAIFWMVERSLSGLPRAKRERMGSHIMDDLLHWFGDSYSREEISHLVIPAIDKRLHEYSGLFAIRPGEEPRVPLLRLFKRVVENVFGTDDAAIDEIMAAILLWWQPISDKGASIVERDRRNKVAW
jgi:hypothetical protein